MEVSNSRLAELDVSTVGIGVLIATREPAKKRVSNYYPILYLDNDPQDVRIIISPNGDNHKGL